MSFLKNLVYDKNGIPSLTDLLALIGFSVFIIGSCYLLFAGKNWDNYDKFAELTGGGGGVLKLWKMGLNKASQLFGKGGEENG